MMGTRTTLNDLNEYLFQEMDRLTNEDLSAEQIYEDMLLKIVEAPTAIHMRMSAKMLIPIISRKLKERGL